MRWILAIAALVVMLILGSVVGCKALLEGSKETRTFTVNHKERSSGDNGVWLVFTDVGVFSAEDSLLLWKFDASDRYNEIRVGKSYSCLVAGWRIHFLSAYENLIDCREV